MTSLQYCQYYPSNVIKVLDDARNNALIIEEIKTDEYITVLADGLQVYRACIRDVEECSTKVNRMISVCNKKIQHDRLMKYYEIKRFLFDHLAAQYRKIKNLSKKETFYDQVMEIFEQVRCRGNDRYVTIPGSFMEKIFNTSFDDEESVSDAMAQTIANHEWSGKLFDITAATVKQILPDDLVKRDIFVIQFMTLLPMAPKSGSIRFRVSRTLMLREIKWRQAYIRDAIHETALRDLSAVIVRYIDFSQV